MPLIAGRPVLDLINTISWRGAAERSQDHLQDAGDCLIWAARAGVISAVEAADLARAVAAEASAATELITRLRDLRTVAADILVPPASCPVDRAEPLIQDALAHSHLIPLPPHAGRGGYRWAVSDVDERTPARRLALDLLSLLTVPHGRLGACADAQCRWVFLDTSRAQNRQWCSSDDCGNRHRVRRHQQRRTPPG